MRLAPFQHVIYHEIYNTYWCDAFCEALLFGRRVYRFEDLRLQYRLVWDQDPSI